MGLILPDTAAPSNLHAPPGTAYVLESDVYNICNRIAEEVPNGHRLFVVLHEGVARPYVVMERCDDGVNRMVHQFEKLDARVIQKLRYLIAVPFEQRFAQAERLEAEANAKREDEQLEEAYETIGAPMHRQLAHDGFIDTHPVSLPKRGIKQTRAA